MPNESDVYSHNTFLDDGKNQLEFGQLNRAEVTRCMFMFQGTN